MAMLHYLTVQDILWINLQATKKVQHFSQIRLEEATFYQYAYGDSRDLLSQTARFLSGFVRMRPLDSGVEATAFIATATFLAINGARLGLADGEGVAWFSGAVTTQDAAKAALEKVVEFETDHHGEHRPDQRAAVRAVMSCYPETIAALLGVASAV